jgi:hypothetical protein
MNTFFCGADLLEPFASTKEWPVDDFGRGPSETEARKAADCVKDALRRKEGHDAISVMAQGFGRALAVTWRTGAEMADRAEAPDSGGQLRRNAAASEKLADLVASTWPVRGYGTVLGRVAEADAQRMFDVDNPDAPWDLASYARRTRAIAESLAVALSARFDEFADAILGPVYEVHPRYMILQHTRWAGRTSSWANLLRPEPRSQAEVDQEYMERAARGDFDLKQTRQPS